MKSLLGASDLFEFFSVLKMHFVEPESAALARIRETREPL
jgi:hypothetical protein